MKVHAIQTGFVRIKSAQVEGRGHGLSRRLAVSTDRDWTEWLPTYAWVIDHRDGVIVVDTGQGVNTDCVRLHLRARRVPDRSEEYGMSVIAISPARETAAADGTPLLRWMIFTGACAFAVVLLWQYGLIHLMVVSDRTYISSIIAALYVVASLHCLWRTIAIGREGDAARRAAGRIEAGEVNFATDAGNALPDGLIGDHIRDLARKARTQGAGHLDQTLLLRALADRLRGSNGFGAFASDTLIKLGLLGTIIGFIIMLAPIAGLDAADRTLLKSSMGLMGDGMAVAMYTTLAGLVGSILLKVQYYMLDAATARVFSHAVRLTETRVVPALERNDAR